MDQYRELLERITRAGGGKPTILRASTEVDGAQILLRPAVGSVVIVGSLTGDLDHLVVLSMDRAEEVIINGGSLGGIVKVKELTGKLNTLEREINDIKQLLSSWTPVPKDGGASLKAAVASWAGKPITLTRREDYEDTKVTH